MAKERRRGRGAGAGQGAERKGGGRQKPEGASPRQGLWIDREQGGNGRRAFDQGAKDKRRRCADRQPQDHPGQGEQADLNQIDVADKSAVCAQRLQNGDGCFARLQMCGDSDLDTKAASDKRGETDKSQKEIKLVDQARKPRGGVRAVADPPVPLVRRRLKSGLQPSLGGGQGRAGGQGDARGFAKRDSCGEESRSFDRGQAGEHPWS